MPIGESGDASADMSRCAVLVAAACLTALAGAEWIDASEPHHGLSVLGELSYPPKFPHFDYVNPDAPRGGTLRLSSRGSFHSLQPFLRQGGAAIGLNGTYDTLLTRAWDEPSALYGLLAETADDVVFTVEILKEKGSPTLKTLLREVTSAEKRGPLTVRIHMSERATRQLPLRISSSLRILPKHYWATREFDKTTLKPPLGSGPYRIGEVKAGRSIAYERVVSVERQFDMTYPASSHVGTEIPQYRHAVEPRQRVPNRKNESSLSSG